jgi:hypothetical protein
MTKITDLPIEIIRIIYEEYDGNYKYRNGKFIHQIPFERKIPIFYVPFPKIFKLGDNWMVYITLQQYNGYDDYSVVLIKQNYAHYCSSNCYCMNTNKGYIFCYLYKRKGMEDGYKNLRDIFYNNTTFIYK